MISVIPSWAQSVAVILGPISLLIVLGLVYFNRNKDVTDKIDKENIDSQTRLLTTLREENAYLKSQNLLKDEKIKNLETLLENQKTDFQRQIDNLSKQVIEIKNGNDQIAAIASTLQLFIPLTKDVEEFHKADKRIIDMLSQLLKIQGLRDKRNETPA